MGIVMICRRYIEHRKLLRIGFDQCLHSTQTLFVCAVVLCLSFLPLFSIVRPNKLVIVTDTESC